MKKFTLVVMLTCTFLGLNACSSEETVAPSTPSSSASDTSQAEAANKLEQAEAMLADSVEAAEQRMKDAMEQSK